MSSPGQRCGTPTLGVVIPLGQHPLPTHVIAHVSDPHLLAERPLYGAVDTHENLRRALSRLARLEVPPHVIVFTGDLADRGEPKAYARLREIVEPAAAAFGAQVVWVMGNHDEREHYARELFGEEVLDDGHPGPRPRRRRPADHRPGHQRPRLPPRRAVDATSSTGCAGSCDDRRPAAPWSRCTTRRSRCR